MIASKDEMIALLRKQLVEAERVGIKKEQENEKRQQELQEIVNRLEQTSQKEQQEAVGVEIQPKLSGNPFQRLFRYWRRSANTKIFIDRYLKNKDYTDGQKEYLLQCLEQGMELKEIERFASANLSTDMMKRLQKLQET